MRAEDVCENPRCRHERKWHDSCSRCRCPQFIEPGARAVPSRKKDLPPTAPAAVALEIPHG